MYQQRSGNDGRGAGRGGMPDEKTAGSLIKESGKDAMVFYRRNEKVIARRKSCCDMIGIAEGAVFEMVGGWLRLGSFRVVLRADLDQPGSLSRTDFHPGLLPLGRHKRMRERRRQCSEQDRAAGDPCSESAHGRKGSHVRRMKIGKSDLPHHTFCKNI